MASDLTVLLSLIDDAPACRELLDRLHRDRSVAAEVLGAARPYLIAALYRRLGRPVLVVTGQPERAKALFEELVTWCPGSPVSLFPEPDGLPYERLATDNAAEIERIQVLSRLVHAPERGPALVIASVPALSQRLLSRKEFESAIHIVRTGMDIEPLKLLARWQSMGYALEAVADVPGTVSHRGGILDIYAPQGELPARLEFFGNTVESIRLYDPVSQRSIRTVPAITVTPATEVLALSSKSRFELDAVLATLDHSALGDESRQLFEQDKATMLEGGRLPGRQFYAPLFNHANLLDYLPEDGLVIVEDYVSVARAAEEFEAKAEEIRAEKDARRELPANYPRPYCPWGELERVIGTRRRLVLTGWAVADDIAPLPFKTAQSFAGQLPAFVQRVRDLLDQKKRVIIVSHQASRLSELLEEQGMIAPVLSGVERVPSRGSLTLVQGLLGEGWVQDGEAYLFTDTELFGFLKQRRLLRRRPVPRHRLSIDITPGVYVVHVEHGIARLNGVVTLQAGQGQATGRREGEKEYLVLEYAGGDKLYVPSDQIDRVTRYIGSGDQPPTLSRLGTQEWTRTRQRVSEAVEEVAKELLELYATREIVTGYAFSRDTIWQQELEASFPYVETPDQLAVQQDVKQDMERSKPMDRLVCGDVGYGKTEIAVRAAFKAVMDHKQVAVLVPTTVLAEQHYVTFTQRFSAFPIKVEVLSRFRTSREQRMILDGLADGTVDVCIGTHRLIQKDVAFKDLGLIIIDEEQRFGVAHKEYLKKKRHEVDVLSLSATPIPRTLHMSLVGVRDMSVMETPPEDRQPVKTYVAAYDDRLVRDAIMRELERNGQVFFLHNRVQSIAFTAGRLQALVPEARVAVAHGQMSEDGLQRVMNDFVHGKADVLVCSTIIESGVDMPNVNTLIVNHADRFGLSQLYQLRGRVGRGPNLAYAYFLYDRGRRLTEVAEKRLNTIYEATELGAGFGIAMKDLEIRGAGNLLGLRQSGHIGAVGFNLYTQLLARAVEDLKARRSGVPEAQVKVSHLPPPAVDLPLPAYIPEDYVEDLNVRIALYQKLVKVDRLEQVDMLAQEFADRFGALRREVQNLLFGVRVKVLGSKASIESIATNEGQIVLRRFEGMRFDCRQLEPFVKGLRLPTGSLHADPLCIRLDLKRIGPGWQKVLEEILKKLVADGREPG